MYFCVSQIRSVKDFQIIVIEKIKKDVKGAVTDMRYFARRKFKFTRKILA